MMTAGLMTAGLVTAALSLAGEWKMLEKMGEKGWKALVPFYGEYLVYKHTWSTKAFWGTLAAGAATGVVAGVAGGVVAAGAGMAVVAPLAGAAIVGSVAATALGVVALHKISRSFGHGVGYTLGMIAAHPIFEMILGFGKSQYVEA